MIMLNVLVNAYAVSPKWGSEPGMGWNWIINLARYCNLYVITEGEWRTEIEKAVADLPQKDNLHFYYNPLPEKIRQMCWNQGDWRFYWYYRKWQKKTLGIAKQIISNTRIDIIHQLNMIGFREPGYLWQIEEIPFVWGPIGGMELMPIRYLVGAEKKQVIFNFLKNIINKYQYLHNNRVHKAVTRASLVIAAVKGVQDVVHNIYNKESILIPETGTDDISANRKKVEPSDTFRILWVGKFDFRKQLHLALQSIIATNNHKLEFHICGTGDNATIKHLQKIAIDGNIQNRCHWYGNVPNEKVKTIMKTCDLLFFTSIMGATSTVVLEAINAGLPILCFNTCGFGSIVKDFAGETIELSNPIQSVQDFSRKINYLYNNREHLDNISQQEIAQRHCLSWKNKAIEVYKYYQQIANKS